MAAYYTYLISSLPALSFFNKMPFNLEELLVKCTGLIPEPEIKILRHIGDADAHSWNPGSGQTLKKWVIFEVALRNELVRARASRQKADPLKFIRLPDFPDMQISHTALAAYRSTSILEGERILDEARWNFLESLSLGHYFDFDILLIYALKLKILERWEKIQQADKQALFNQTVLN